MRKTRTDLVLEEIDNCYDILESMEIERDISVILQDLDATKEAGNGIISMKKRIAALQLLLEKANNPQDHMDFMSSIVVKGA